MTDPRPTRRPATAPPPRAPGPSCGAARRRRRPRGRPCLIGDRIDTDVVRTTCDAYNEPATIEPPV